AEGRGCEGGGGGDEPAPGGARGGDPGHRGRYLVRPDGRASLRLCRQVAENRAKQGFGSVRHRPTATDGESVPRAPSPPRGEGGIQEQILSERPVPWSRERTLDPVPQPAFGDGHGICRSR